MRIYLSLILLALACKRELPPRDYQNAPPAMTHPATSSAQSPAQNGMPNAAPEPGKGVEGKTNGKPTSPNQATLKLKDQPPANTTTTATTGTQP